MGRIYRSIKNNSWMVLVILGLLLVAMSSLSKLRPDYTGQAARKLGQRVEKRMETLRGHMDAALATPSSEWIEIENALPEDMVLYRYINDSLYAWVNQFTTDNDDISRRLYLPRLTPMDRSPLSPLLYADEGVSYINMGQRWYLVSSITNQRGDCKVIGGLLIRSESRQTRGAGVNPKLKFPESFSLYPISAGAGAPVSVEGKPVFKVVQEQVRSVVFIPDPPAIWAAVVLCLMGAVLFLRRKRTLRRLSWVLGVSTVLCLLFYLVGMRSGIATNVFSPTVFADGPVFYSLGAVLVINLYILTTVLSLFVCRRSLLERLGRGRKRLNFAILGSLIIVAVAGIAIYTHISLSSIMLNSSIPLEFHKINELGLYSAYVYISYLTMLMSIPLLLQMLRPSLKFFTGIRFNPLSRLGRALFSAMVAAYMLILASVLGFRREEGKVDIWSSRMAVDRDISFELRLRNMERRLMNDALISGLINSGQNYSVILSMVNENYLGRKAQDYDVNMVLLRPGQRDPVATEYIASRLQGALAIADSTNFLYSRSQRGVIQYTGRFHYAPSGAELVICLDSRSDREDRGWSAIFGMSSAGNVKMPPIYSSARYLDSKLISFRGEYSYPTIMSERLKEMLQDGQTHIEQRGYVHFANKVSPREVVVVSRPSNNPMQSASAAFALFLMVYFGLALISLPGKGRIRREMNYYKSRINTVLFLSLFVTLLAMATVSIVFVYRRNEVGISNLMSGKINTIQSLMASNSRHCESSRDYLSREMNTILENIAEYTRTDISVYSSEGRMIRSTNPEVFRRQLVGCRVHHKAYRNIIYQHRNYFIAREKMDGVTYYVMYAPVFNEAGRMTAIVGAPYTDSWMDFRVEIIMHAFFIIIIFFVLLLSARLLTTRVVDKMFSPLGEMGRKMMAARTRGLEYIIYEREDEISSLVRAYNLMVHDLAQSSKQAAQVERDKAWSEMARQVAHDIKNPLTPIKLQIQRVIRLKQKNDPAWEEKLDSIIPVILESIDELTDRANEFSTFANLYNEEPVDMDLDVLAATQLNFFAEKDNISFQYIGLSNSIVSGPKPQLTRVFVNLLTNAIQAIENTQKEAASSGEKVQEGQIVLSLRNSTRDGFYDLVFEDNGPGVSDEHRSKLFTPKFTTKSGGTGLGLAICKNIVERCGGEILYSKSFTLGGACFTVRYPKKES